MSSGHGPSREDGHSASLRADIMSNNIISSTEFKEYFVFNFPNILFIFIHLFLNTFSANIILWMI